MRNEISIMAIVVSFLIFAGIPHAFGVTNGDSSAIKPNEVVISDSQAISIFEKVIGKTETDIERKNVIKAFHIIRPSLKDTESMKRLSSMIEKAAKSTENIILEDGTPYIINLMQVAERLDNETKAQVQLMVSATPSGLNQTKITNHFEIHYTLDSGSPDNTSIDFVNKIADYFEKSYQTEIIDWGFKEGNSGILSSKYQVFINHIDDEPGYITFGVTKPHLVLDGTTIEINNRISGYSDGLKLGTVAHEYHHASQNSYIYIYALLSKIWVIEGSAAWMEHEVFLQYFPNNVIDFDFTLFRDRMNTYLDFPYKDISDKRGDNGYPSGLYFYFLADNNKINFNGVGIQRTVNRKIWDELGLHSWGDVNGAFDGALSSAPAEYNSFDKSFKPFTKANYFKTIYYPTEIINFNDVSRKIVDLTSVQSVTETSGIGGVFPVDHYAADYFKVQAPGSSYVKISFKANDKDANFYLRVYPEDVETTESIISLTDGEGTLTTKAENTAIIVGRLNDGGLLGTPNGNFEITFELVNLIIISPTTALPSSAEAFDNPVHFDVILEVKDGTTPVSGLSNSNFNFKIGGKSATSSLIDTSIPGYYKFDITPPTQVAAGNYDLEVIASYSGINLNDSEINAVVYTSGNVDVELIIDRSGSMSGTPLTDAKTSAKLFVDYMRDNDKAGVVTFETSAMYDYQLTSLTPTIKNSIKNSINNIYSGGVTAMGSGLRYGLNDLTSRGDSTHPWAMVLLSDGYHNSGEDPYNVLPEIRNNNIKVYTVGLGSYVDRNLLENIALNSGAGGGKYYYAPSSNDLKAIYDSIVGTITGQQTVLSTTGTISPAQTTSLTVPITSFTTSSTFSISWGGSDLDLVLFKPDGSIVDPTVAANDPNIDYIEEATYEFYRVANPDAGIWTMETTAISVPVVGEVYSTTVRVASPLTISLSTDKDQYNQGETVKTTTSLTQNGTPLTGSTVIAQISLPDNSNETFTLYDDGGHGDIAANDGVYANYFANTLQTGNYKVYVKATGSTNTGEQYSREVEISLKVVLGQNLINSTPDKWIETTNPGEQIKSTFALSDPPNIGELFPLDANTFAVYNGSHFLIYNEESIGKEPDYIISDKLGSLVSESKDTSQIFSSSSIVASTQISKWVSLTATSLQTSNGDIIDTKNIIITPNTVQVPLVGSVDFNVSIMIPRNAVDGIYNGKIVATAITGSDSINVEITVISPNSISNCTTISSPGKYRLNRSINNSNIANCISIISSDVIFDGAGYTIDGNGLTNYGLYASNVNRITVRNLVVQDWNSRAVNIVNSNNNNFSNITVKSGNYDGFYLQNSNNNILRKIKVQNTVNVGFTFDNSQGNSLNDSIFQNNAWEDFDIYPTGGVSACNNEVGNVSLTRYPLYYSNRSVHLKDIFAGAIYLCNADNSTVTNATVAANGQSSISNYYVDNVTYSNITTSGLKEAIFFKNSANNNITNILMKDGWSGITYSTNTNNTNYKNATIYNMTDRAVRIYGGASRNTISDSKIFNNSVGIYLNTAGKYGPNKIYNSFFNNSRNIEWGTGLSGDSFFGDGTVYLNYWNTTKQSGTNIIGGINLGGNFWAYPNGTGFGQTCTDADGDGICDSFYTLRSNNIDYLPLALPSIPSITIVSPNGGENWAQNSTQVIRWNFKVSPGPNVMIELLKNGIVNSVITSSTPIGSTGSGSYNWFIDPAQTPDADYKVRIASTTNSTYTDTSDNNFIISDSVNLVKNGGFESGMDNWTCYSNAANECNIIPPGILRFKLINIGSNMQLYQYPLPMEPNTPYRLSFAAYSTYGHDMIVKLIKHVGGTLYSPEFRPDLTTGWQTFSYNFTSTSSAMNDARLMFWFVGTGAIASEEYYIDNIRLEKVISPGIKIQPLNQTVTAGQNATFTVVASGTLPLRYQWQKNGVNITNNATNVSYTTPATIMSDNLTTYRVNVANDAGSVMSNSATLIVISSPIPPIITTQPSNQTVNEGQNATFVVVASGTAPLSYQWQKNGTNIPGATNSSYITPAAKPSDNGTRFCVIISNVDGSVTSNNATLTVIPSNTLITVISPDGGENWIQGSTQEIRWNYAGSPGQNVIIELLKNGMLNSVLNSSTSIGSGGSGSYTWQISLTQTPGADYKVRINSTTDPAYTDTSNNDFTISSPPGQQLKVNITPALQTVSTGKNLSISIFVDPDTFGISAGQIDLAFNASVFRITGVTKGDILGNDAFDTGSSYDNAAGTVNAVLARIGPTSVPTNPGNWTTVDLIVNQTARAGTYPINITFTGIVDETFTDIANIRVNNGSIRVISLPGDINCDCIVNYKDLGILGAAYGKTRGVPGYREDADLNGDGIINYKDLGILGANYGRTC